jgi:hypothetical protein
VKDLDRAKMSVKMVRKFFGQTALSWGSEAGQSADCEGHVRSSIINSNSLKNRHGTWFFLPKYVKKINC